MYTLHGAHKWNTNKGTMKYRLTIAMMQVEGKEKSTLRAEIFS